MHLEILRQIILTFVEIICLSLCLKRINREPLNFSIQFNTTKINHFKATILIINELLSMTHFIYPFIFFIKCLLTINKAVVYFFLFILCN